ncbi:hypothetical protein [Corallococcus carmarthensis]|uniref:hypothetical protein n=1 Tax=Corallococcus carmarthensis TaxID=2316728 RepID=UPI0013150855|nr:hypothetical protein [Corallococcus carmarthensis]
MTCRPGDLHEELGCIGVELAAGCGVTHPARLYYRCAAIQTICDSTYRDLPTTGPQ